MVARNAMSFKVFFRWVAMRALLTLSFVTLLFIGGKAQGACAPLVFGYFDQSSPPYYLGAGSTTPEPPGVTVDLMREITTSVGCMLILKRLPSTRLQSSIESGAITAAAFGVLGHEAAQVVFPRDANGQVDKGRSLQQIIVVFVRKNVPIDSDPAIYFKGRTLGTTHGVPYGNALRAAGYVLDDGAMDPKSSFDKLMLHRIDGYATALVNPGDMDAVVDSRYGGALVRLSQPLFVTKISLAINKEYYANNRVQVEQMWDWIGKNANRRFAELLQKYEEQ
jgi:hypothetical protein